MINLIYIFLISLFLIFSQITEAQLDYYTGEQNYNFHEGECYAHIRKDEFFHITKTHPLNSYGYVVAYKKDLFSQKILLINGEPIWTKGEWKTLLNKDLSLNYVKSKCVKLF